MIEGSDLTPDEQRRINRRLRHRQTMPLEIETPAPVARTRHAHHRLVGLTPRALRALQFTERLARERQERRAARGGPPTRITP